MDHTTITRETLLSATKPLIIRGATDSWAARTAWQLDELVAR